MIQTFFAFAIKNGKAVQLSTRSIYHISFHAAGGRPRTHNRTLQIKTHG